MIYACCQGKRAESVRAHPTLNAVEFLEVLDADAPIGSPNQRTLLVRCCKPVVGLDRDNVRIEGGARIRPVAVTWAASADTAAGLGLVNAAEALFLSSLEEPGEVLVVRTDVFGDFSTYTLRLVAGPGLSGPPADFDPVLSSVDFTFKAECPTPFDCLRPRTCPPEPVASPLVNYLARDYGTLRQTLLDRMALLVPDWSARHPADLGVALVELLAYVGDSLSYQQDAIATEAYLPTARRRVSARRHARLVDYFMHDGANARTWIQIDVRDAATPLPARTQLLTRTAPLDAPIVDPLDRRYAAALAAGSQAFETMHPLVLYPAHGAMRFHTWGDAVCVLPRCATRATLRDGTTAATRLLLRPDDVLLLEEVKGPTTGRASDADPTRRHVVRLTRVEPAAMVTLLDGVETRTPAPALVDPLTDEPIVHVEWHPEDALPFPVCVSSSFRDTSGATQLAADVSVARGNVVLADHGRTLPGPEALGVVPPPAFSSVPEQDAAFCGEPEDEHLVLPRFRPDLAAAPVTQVGRVLLPDGATAPFDPQGSAASAFRWELRRALPAVVASAGADDWTPRRDLLDSTDEDRHLVVEVENDGHARLRFGDGTHGRRPAAGSSFTARYRVGNGAAGNVGRDTLLHLVDPGGTFSPAAVVRVRNPLPAAGGVEPETIEEVRQRAPYAFRTQERAVTADDYVAAALRRPELQGAAARFRWTGSWRTVSVTLDPLGRDAHDEDPGLAASVRDHLEKFRLAGYDLVVDDPLYVSLEIGLHVCVQPGYFAADVERALRDVFTSGHRADGTPGLFHPDRFRFGAPVHLSPLVQAALGVAGVHDVRVLVFQRAGNPDAGQALADGVIPLGRLEVARLDDDPNFPENGVLSIALEGGR